MDARPTPLFDRRAPAALIKLLADGGQLSGLIELVREMDELDIYTRASPKHLGQGQVTVYVGLTKAFDLCARDTSQLKVVPQATHGPREEAEQRGWTRWGPASELAADPFLRWAKQMVSVAREESQSKIDHEGMVQARVGAGVDGWFAAIDRETMFAFESTAATAIALQKLREPLAGTAARVRESSGEPWTQRDRDFARKLDVLGVDSDGRLLVIEVKPGAQTSTLAWTPFQVAQYTALVKAWVESEPRAAEILNGMIAQREQLGLLQPERWRVSTPVDLVPVVAVGLPVKSPVATTRMRHVHQAVAECAPDLINGLQYWSVRSDGEIQRRDLEVLRDDDAWTSG